jgi:RNA polymerase sigma-70 factor (ECF subfamily)
VAEFIKLLFGVRRFTLVPTRANGQPAFGAYVHAADGVHRASGFITVTIVGDKVAELNRFEPSVFEWFGLPPVLG